MVWGGAHARLCYNLARLLYLYSAPPDPRPQKVGKSLRIGIKLRHKVKDKTTLMLVVFAVIVVGASLWLASYKPVLMYVGLVIAGLIIKRLFFARLRVSSGDSILFFGLPGSGKTMFAVKTALDNNDRICYTNPELTHYDGCAGVYSRDDFAVKAPVPGSIILYDEASINGFDNRDFAQNFENNQVLEFLKKIRHYDTAIIWTNQGWDELDKKIRQGLTNRTYYCTNHGWYSKAVELRKTIDISDISGEPLESYYEPSLIDRLFDPSCVLYCVHRRVGKHYLTCNPRKRRYKDII